MRWPAILLFAGIAACSSPAPMPMEIIVQGHRGCRGMLPENTVPALLRAVDLGVSTLEFDVVITADHRIVLSHDPFLAHEICLGPQGESITKDTEQDFNIYRMTYDSLKLCNCGSLVHPRFPDQQTYDFLAKPLLSEAIEAIKFFCAEMNLPLPSFNIEIKSRPEWVGEFHPAPEEYVSLFFGVFDTLGIAEITTIQSFDPAIINAVHASRPDIRAVYLSEDLLKSPEVKLSEIKSKPYGYSVHFKMVNASVVQYCHDNDLHLSVWTVNEISDMEQMISLGVTDIITDYPERLISLLLQKGIPVRRS
jgi:glycerophosphoryl diester phosphodiesterase